MAVASRVPAVAQMSRRGIPCRVGYRVVGAMGVRGGGEMTTLGTTRRSPRTGSSLRTTRRAIPTATGPLNLESVDCANVWSLVCSLVCARECACVCAHTRGCVYEPGLTALLTCHTVMRRRCIAMMAAIKNVRSPISQTRIITRLCVSGRQRCGGRLEGQRIFRRSRRSKRYRAMVGCRPRPQGSHG